METGTIKSRGRKPKSTPIERGELKLDRAVLKPAPRLDEPGWPQLDRSSLTTQATELIRQAIVQGDLAPGVAIGIRDLARKINVSPTPIREALFNLSAIGLTEMQPGKVRIVAANADTLREAFELREGLEGMAARLAAERRTPSEARQIGDLARKSNEAATAGQREEFRALDRLFHTSIAKAARSTQLERYLENALDLALTLRNLHSLGKGFRAAWAHMHVELADAITRKRPDDAYRISCEHIRLVCETTIKDYEKGRAATAAT